MNRKSFIITTMVSFYGLFSWGQIQKDSIFLEESFLSIIAQPQKEDSLLNVIETQLDLRNDTLNDYYDFIRSKFYIRSGQLDKALTVTENRLNDGYNLELQDGKYHNLRGAAFSMQNKTNEAINSFIEASRKYEARGNHLRAALIKNNIANIYFGLNKHEKAYSYLIQCFEVLKDFPENEYYPRILGTLSISSALTNRFVESREYADRGLAVAHEKNDSIALALLNYAKGELALSEGNYERAESYLKISMSIAQQYNLQQNKLLAQVLLIKTYNLLKRYREAVEIGEASLHTAEKLPNKTIFIAIHRGLKDAYSHLNNFEKAFYHLSKLDDLKDLSRSESIEAKTDSLLIAFESEKKDLALQMKDLEISQAEEKVRNQQLFVAVLILMLIVLLGFVILYIRTKKTQLLEIKLAKEKEIIHASLEGEKKERTRLSSELHDGISAELTALKIKLTNDEASSLLIDQISELQNDVRRMAHSLSPTKLKSLGLAKALAQYCQQIRTSKTKIHFSTNLDGNTFSWNDNVVNIIYRSVQEIIQNAIKHAAAKNIDVQIFLNENDQKLNITVEDDGLGFDLQETIVNPNGHKRINALGGDIEYESNVGKGTIVMITLNTKKIEEL